MIACKKKEMNIGTTGISQSELLISGAIDTFQLITYSEKEDSLISSNNAFTMLGSYQDPVFGKAEAEFYTQLRLQSFNPVFNLDKIHIDSFVLGLEYTGYYGTLEEQTFEVYELADDLFLDSTYYSFHTKNVKGANLLMPESRVQKPKPSERTIIGTNTVNPQLRLHLDTALARVLMLEANNTNTFSSNQNFLNYFKGLNVKVANTNFSDGQGAMLYFNLTASLSKLTIYYRNESNTTTTFDFLINSDCADFNHLKFENSTKKPGLIQSNQSLGLDEYYSQAYNIRAKVDIPYLNNIPKNAVIQYAKLELPVSFYSFEAYLPSNLISVGRKISFTDERLFNLMITGEYNDFTKSYVLDLKNYIQDIVSNRFPNRGIYVSPVKFVNSLERIVFNGSSSLNKKKPKLYIVYTTFN
jgi:hypothetical protein